MTVQTSAGCKIYIGTAETTPSPDDYLEIGEVTNFSEFGRVYQEIRHDAIGTRGTRKFKGTYDDGNITLQLGRDPSDVGQAAAILARDDDEDYNFKITLNDEGVLGNPTTFTFKAKVMSYTTNIGGPNQVVGATMMLGIKSGSIDETAAT